MGSFSTIDELLTEGSLTRSPDLFISQICKTITPEQMLEIVMKFSFVRYLICFPLLLCLLYRCSFGCENEAELKFDARQQQRLDIYHEGDTIYYSDNSGNKDTIVITELKSWTNNCMLHASSIMIKHLPDNSWIDGYEAKDGKLIPLDQTLLIVEKQIYEPEYVGINYRNFRGKITDTAEVKSDTLFNYCNQHSYLVIKNDAANAKRFEKDLLHIMKIFWTEKYGLSGYELRNGTIFRIEN